jgi:hypothetical protein
MLPRVLTALSVIAICGFAAWRGYEIIGFAIASNSASTAPGFAERLRAWTDVPGVAGAAREALLTVNSRGGTPDAALIDLIAVRPLAAIDWLSLAGRRIEMGSPQNQVLAALTMSRISGPNEEEAMLRRALLGMLQWATMPEEVQGQTAHDLAGVFEQGVVEPSAVALIKAVLATKSRETRAALAERLRAEQMPTAKLAQIGL